MGFKNFSGSGNNPNSNIPTGGNPSGGNPLAGLLGGMDDDFDIADYTIDYNQKFKNGSYAMFRDEIVQQMMGILIGKNKPNVLLVGAAGVGKTKIVEDIAMRIENDDPTVPTALYDSIIYELPLSNLVSGSSYVGQLEEKVKNVIEFAMDKKNKAILFIDEIHQLINGNPTYEKIAQILKPALSRGDLKVIGATTLQESQNFMDDPALNRRFSRVIVDELSRGQTIDILKDVKASYTQHYDNKVLIDDSLLEPISIIADQYAKAGYHRPDTALTLLDRACGDTIVARNLQINTALAQNNQTVAQMLKQSPTIPLTEKQVRKTALKLMTGHNTQENLNRESLENRLAPIKGQDNVLDIVIDALVRDNLGLYPRNKPLTFLFAGKSGVGKTEVAKTIAEELTEIKPITLNMTEYHSPASINRIIGSSAGYVGYDSNAELPFDILESNPFQVILLDEFEKADKSVQRLFMGAFEEGHIKTSRGQIVDFSKAIIIATTNASHSAGKSNAIGFGTGHNTTQNEKISDLANWFDMELLNRFDHVLTFNALDKNVYRDIIQSIYMRDIARIKKEASRPVNLPDELGDKELDQLIQDTYVADFGARPAQKAVKKYIENTFI